VFLPKEQNGISKLEKIFDHNYYARVADSMHSKKVRLSLPKFKTTDEFQLAQVLEKMGMHSAFTARADFSGMATERLFINKVIHKAFVSVTEDGTEAAAATAVVMDRATVMNPSLFEVFNANHPFIFVIRDNGTGCILFMGKIADPTK
jgi:serpin B